MRKAIAFLYGLACYLIFFLTFLYAIGFTGNFIVPKTIDSGAEGSLTLAILINVSILLAFAVQHTIMARPGFKERWTKIIPEPMERSTFVLIASGLLGLLFWQWRPMGDVIWDVSGTALGTTLMAISLVGWLVVLISTFLLDHFELFGLKQVYYHLKGEDLPVGRLRQPAFYKVVRHPIYFGFAVAFWATPVMTTAHLLFAVGTLGYMLVGIFLEER